MNLKSHPLQDPHTSLAPVLSPGPAQLSPPCSPGVSLTQSVPQPRAPVSTLVRKCLSSVQNHHSSEFYTKRPRPPHSPERSNPLAPCAHLLSPSLTLLATWAPSLFLKHTRHSQPSLRAFALVAAPSTRDSLPPDTHMAASLTSFWSLLRYHLLSETHRPPQLKLYVLALSCSIFFHCPIAFDHTICLTAYLVSCLSPLTFRLLQGRKLHSDQNYAARAEPPTISAASIY